MSTRTRILITGCRHWNCDALADRVIARLIAKHGRHLVIVHGDAPDVDTAFANAASRAIIPDEPHSADWKRLGNAAGPRRNEAMVNAGASLCIAVHRDIRSSKGTRGCALLAIGAGIKTVLIDSEEGEPR